MTLYTVLLKFHDGETWIDQYSADNPDDALLSFIQCAKCLDTYDRKWLMNIILKRKKLLTHLWMWLRGVWVIDFWTDLLDTFDFSNILSWYIIQTDNQWVIRKN